MSRDSCEEAGSERLLREHVLVFFVYAEYGEDFGNLVQQVKSCKIRQSVVDQVESGQLLRGQLGCVQVVEEM